MLEAQIQEGFHVPERFAELREAGKRCVERGELHQALDLFEQAVGVARRSGDEKLLALAVCNRAAASIALGSTGELPSLRQILMQTLDPKISFLASYNLSQACEVQKEFKKGLFYAQIAESRAVEHGSASYRAAALNQRANNLLGDSHFEQAIKAYHEALDLLHEEASVSKAMILANLGYSALLLGRRDEGFDAMLRGERWFRRTGSRPYEGSWAALYLSYAYLEEQRVLRAWRYAERALWRASHSANSEVEKKVLYLQGEIEREVGDFGAAHDRFTMLQRRFYPDQDDLADRILAAGARQLVNLRA